MLSAESCSGSVFIWKTWVQFWGRLRKKLRPPIVAETIMGEYSYTTPIWIGLRIPFDFGVIFRQLIPLIVFIYRKNPRWPSTGGSKVSSHVSHITFGAP